MKKLSVLLTTLFMIVVFSVPAFAGTWKQDAKGWWWDNGDGTYPTNCWKWCDGNGDGIAESYYFDANGYCLMNTTTPDGYQVNADGAWIENGVVQTIGEGTTQAPAQAAANNNNREYSKAEDIAAARSLVATLKTRLKFPSTLQLYGIAATTYQATGYTYREIKIEYAAMNSIGMMVRDYYTGYITPDGNLTTNALHMMQAYGDFIRTTALSTAAYSPSEL